jgi:Ner family transcriptional regulator
MHTTHPPRQPAQLRAWIKYRLELSGTNLQQLAERNHLSRNAVRAALSRSYPRAEAIIAKALGMKPADIWPDRYDEYGLPLRGMPTPAKIAAIGARRAQRARG